MNIRMLLLASAVMVAAASVASARTKTFVIDGYDLRVFNGGAITAGFETHDGVGLADTGFGELYVTFTLPADYKKNSPVTLTLFMYGGSNNINPCDVALLPDGAFRYRNNAPVTSANGVNAGVTAVDGSATFTRPAANALIKPRSYKVRKVGSGILTTGTIRDQLPGDRIEALFLRHAVSSADTCTLALIINSAKITYTVK